MISGKKIYNEKEFIDLNYILEMRKNKPPIAGIVWKINSI